ncbi:MAG: hypothetical protein A3C50_03345 [Candidatus Staskawiczbacteria bacterium RIFCSPHIGHO2_02_FULL_43_16]|uniref:Uncharacterized protein n=1 Tax=Candidatus Staskawiczbacteria bacterium RIFCSPHIGHO2_01_FULL_41_41 TaxID=1802203 RepID=A0A1G2HSZ6_9BACT|nr:MAG: hypothetical protein A2822_02450 [Candidatus Staskawiczbacteria bacterium RIFCSPHIGHO2_01_FULL_41_41]OGZ67976.1 MAG: hypothetical protein A3C50_03345 [Candidatus Staskawiczbacteria bacterium RIFCSPHIGHO2_02_FULL_43_16]OGZ74541.1 MAG: hypothetical protein A3A12_02145 [Candidatus Staskawiczbacteria bacterium RIFCSPLOWO2_01_FULL_43_17b]
MSYFFWLSIALLVSTLIFYAIFAGLIYYWHEKKTTVVVVPLLFTFEFFSIGFLVICLITLLIQSSPDILKLISN